VPSKDESRRLSQVDLYMERDANVFALLVRERAACGGSTRGLGASRGEEAVGFGARVVRAVCEFVFVDVRFPPGTPTRLTLLSPQVTSVSSPTPRERVSVRVTSRVLLSTASEAQSSICAMTSQKILTEAEARSRVLPVLVTHSRLPPGSRTSPFTVTFAPPRPTGAHT